MSAETPAINRPRWRISAIVEPDGMPSGSLAGAKDCSRLSQSWATGAAPPETSGGAGGAGTGVSVTPQAPRTSVSAAAASRPSRRVVMRTP